MPAKYEVAADADGGEDNPPCPDWASGVLRCRDGAGAPGECAVEQSVSLAEAVAGCRGVRCLAGKSRWPITAGRARIVADLWRTGEARAGHSLSWASPH